MVPNMPDTTHHFTFTVPKGQTSSLAGECSPQSRSFLALNDRHAKEGAEAVLFDGGDIFEAGVFLRIGEVDRFRQAANQPHQAFIERQRNA